MAPPFINSSLLSSFGLIPYFHYYRAVVDSVITINGTGLGSEACQNVVMFGDTNCTVLSQSDTWLTCEVSNQTDILLTNRNVAFVSEF